MKYFKQSFLFFAGGVIGFSLSLATIAYSSSDNIAARLSGRILLQVEQNGEAWYVNPTDLRKYYLGRPKDAFDTMRNFGLGVSDSDLLKITTGYLQTGPTNTKASQGNSGDNGSRYHTYVLKNKVVRAIQDGDLEELKPLFIDDLQHSLEYTMEEYDADERSRWAAMISDSDFLEEEGDVLIYRTYVGFNNNTVEHDYRMKKNEEGTWQLLNL